MTATTATKNDHDEQESTETQQQQQQQQFNKVIVHPLVLLSVVDHYKRVDEVRVFEWKKVVFLDLKQRASAHVHAHWNNFCCFIVYLVIFVYWLCVRVCVCVCIYWVIITFVNVSFVIYDNRAMKMMMMMNEKTNAE